jgi:hypothetical protein
MALFTHLPEYYNYIKKFKKSNDCLVGSKLLPKKFRYVNFEAVALFFEILMKMGAVL